jgi:acyl dehydratase
MGSIGPTPRRSRIVNEATINMADKSPRYAEDYRVGEVFDLGQIVITRDEIIEFSKMWDPQPFHVDERNAGTSAYGGLVASGWHVTLLMMRMMNDSGFISHETSLGSPGHDGLKWLKAGSAGRQAIRYSRNHGCAHLAEQAGTQLRHPYREAAE